MHKALRDHTEIRELTTCHREYNFVEMYAALGDEEAQGKIRAKHEDKHHCVYLRRSCMACQELPKDIGDAKAGDICPNNPFHKHAERFAEADSRAWLVERAESEMRLPSPVTLDSSPIDVTIFRAVAEWQEAERLKAEYGSSEISNHGGVGPSGNQGPEIWGQS